MSSSKFKFVCLHMHAHTQGVKNSFAKGVLKPHCNNACECAKEESNENTALSLPLTVTPGKSISLAPMALVHGKTRGLCLCCGEDKAHTLAVLRESSICLSP